jgi:hypothetical protein
MTNLHLAIHGHGGIFASCQRRRHRLDGPPLHAQYVNAVSAKETRYATGEHGGARQRGQIRIPGEGVMLEFVKLATFYGEFCFVS